MQFVGFRRVAHQHALQQWHDAVAAACAAAALPVRLPQTTAPEQVQQKLLEQAPEKLKDQLRMAGSVAPGKLASVIASIDVTAGPWQGGTLPAISASA